MEVWITRGLVILVMGLGKIVLLEIMICEAISVTGDGVPRGEVFVFVIRLHHFSIFYVKGTNQNILEKIHYFTHTKKKSREFKTSKTTVSLASEMS